MDPTEGEPGVAGTARQTLKQLATRWGVEEPATWDPPPVLIRVKVMHDRMETWRKWAPAGEPKKPMETEYQLIESGPLT